MNANREKTRRLLNEYYGGNYNKFAKELELDPSHLHRFLTEGVGGGKKLIGAIIKFCNNKKLNFIDYVDL